MFSETDCMNYMKSISDDFKLNLFTTFYISENKARNEEIKTCLIKNANNPYIKKIYLLNDNIYDLDFITDNKDKIIQIEVDEDNKKRLGFDYVINFTNENFKDEICIIANSDIYYDETLVLLNKYDLTKKVFALARYEDSDKKLIPNSLSSQDTWIYRSPIKIDINLCDFKFGVPGCDHRIGYLFSKYNNVINPCLTIKSYHNHSSNYRTYTEKDRILGEWLFIKESKLDMTHCFLELLNDFIDKDGMIIMTFINGGYFPYLYNYVQHIKKLNLTWKLCIVCVDNESYSLCNKYNIPCLLYNISNISGFNISATDDFKNVAMLKIDVISLLLKNKNIKTLLYTDTDMSIYKDFIPYLKSLSDTHIDIYFQSDNGKSDINMFDTNKCTGFMYMKNNEAIRELFTRIPIFDLEKSNLADQNYINHKLTRMNNIVSSQLPRNLFPNGVFYNNKCIPQDAFILHYNYMKGHDKKENMKLNNDWLSNELEHVNNIKQENIVSRLINITAITTNTSISNNTTTLKKKGLKINYIPRHRIR